MAKSASFFSANSLTCRGVMICSASSLRSSGLTGGISRALQLAVQPNGGGPADLEQQVGGVPLDHLGDGLLEVEGRTGEAPAAFAAQPLGSTRKRTCPNSTGWPSSTKISRTMPAISASISFMIFIASMMHTVWPGVTRVPTLT